MKGQICKNCGTENDMKLSTCDVCTFEKDNNSDIFKNTCSYCGKKRKSSMKCPKCEMKKHFIFIIHAEIDECVALAFQKMLENILKNCVDLFQLNIECKPFCSSDCGYSIKCGDNSHEKIHAGLDKSDNIFCLLTQKSYKKPWLAYEVGYARGKSKNKKLIPIAIGMKYRTTLVDKPYSNMSVKVCDKQHLSLIIIDLIKNIHPQYNAHDDRALNDITSRYINKFFTKVPKECNQKIKPPKKVKQKKSTK